MKKRNFSFSSDLDTSGLQTANVPWQKVSQEMTEDELEKIRSMNWEWYYHCYLYIDQYTPILCKRCGQFNVFAPREKTRKCENCGAETKRCDKEEEL